MTPKLPQRDPSKGSTLPALVLVVDDDEAASALAREDLEGAGYRVITEDNIDGGLAVTRARQVDVILLDIGLPRASGTPALPMGGIDAIPEFRSANPSAEVIMFSSHDRARTGMEALRRGACDFVVKPYPPQQVISAVERAIEHGRTRREVAYLREPAQRSRVQRVYRPELAPPPEARVLLRSGGQRLGVRAVFLSGPWRAKRLRLARFVVLAPHLERGARPRFRSRAALQALGALGSLICAKVTREG